LGKTTAISGINQDMMAISFIFCGLKRKEGIPVDSESLHDG
jgi:hypothetical protein